MNQLQDGQNEGGQLASLREEEQAHAPTRDAEAQKPTAPASNITAPSSHSTRARRGLSLYDPFPSSSRNIWGGGRYAFWNASFWSGERMTKRRRRWRLWYKKKWQPYWKVSLAQSLCVIYILIATFSPPPVGVKDPSTGNILDPNSAENTNEGVIFINGDYRPVVAIGGWQKFCLTISRMCAFSMYPMLVIVFITKMKGLQSFFAQTPLSMYFGVIKEGHDHHVHAGKYIAFGVWVHAIPHVFRWLSQGNINLLWNSTAGLTGLIAISVIPLIAFAMMYLKRKLNYEIRKGLHYLFYVFAITLCFHVPSSAIPNGGFLLYVMAPSIVLYTIDTAFVICFMTEKIETTSFYVLSSGVRVSMPVSEKFLRRARHRGGYAYINIPWVNDKEWHPFSLFEDPDDPSIQQVFFMKEGDWTRAVHTALTRDTQRPCWIKGPFPSPYSRASMYDNQILIASGIGITPALSAINAFKLTRRVNLIWAVRDPEMLRFFLDQMYLEHNGWNLIFYTGKQPLPSALESTATNIRVIKGRPKFDSVIPNMIYGIESMEGLPEKYTDSSTYEMKEAMRLRSSELEQDETISATERVSKFRDYGYSLGLSMNELFDDSNRSGVGTHSMQGSTAKNEHQALMEADESDAQHRFNQLKYSLRCDGSNLGPSTQKRSRRPKRWSVVREVVDGKDPDTLKPKFCPWEENESQEKCVKRLDEAVMATWGMLYCGGSQPVIKALRDVSLDYSIDLHVDSFAW